MGDPLLRILAVFTQWEKAANGPSFLGEWEG